MSCYNKDKTLFNFEKIYSNYDGNNLSDGERLKVLLSNLSNNIRKFVLLDEPFINLDNKSKQILHQWIADMKNKGINFLIISHEFDPLFDNYIDEFHSI